MDLYALGKVDNFKVFRKDSVMIEFHNPVSLIGLNISKVFYLGVEGSIRIYNVPQSFLNVPCSVTFYNCDKISDVSELMKRSGACYNRDAKTLKIKFNSLSDISFGSN